MKKHEKFIERDDLKGATHLEVSVYYTKGGRSYFSSGVTQRGYYISVTPITIRGNMTSYAMFSGRKQLLFETARYSDKQLTRAIEMAKDVEDELIAAVVAENISVNKAA
jgi:hypothetical protein